MLSAPRIQYTINPLVDPLSIYLNMLMQCQHRHNLTWMLSWHGSSYKMTFTRSRSELFSSQQHHVFQPHRKPSLGHSDQGRKRERGFRSCNTMHVLSNDLCATFG